MSKSRIQSFGRKTRRTTKLKNLKNKKNSSNHKTLIKKQSQAKSQSKNQSKSQPKNQSNSQAKNQLKQNEKYFHKTQSKCLKFLGLSLAGGKTDKSCISVVEYYPEHKKIFLARLFDKIKTDAPLISADFKVHEILSQYQGESELLAFDVPLTLPKCVTCLLTCPGYEVCHEPEIKWLRHFYEQINKNKKPKRVFTPYTQRCTESFLTTKFDEKFELQHTLGANLAPLVARALFIRRRLQIKCIEVIPKISIWQLGHSLKISKSHLRFHRHSVSGEDSRRIILNTIVDKLGIFIYQQDLKIMIENYHAFESFISAYTACLSYRSMTMPRPADFPKNEAWVEIPI